MNIQQQRIKELKKINKLFLVAILVLCIFSTILLILLISVSHSRYNAGIHYGYNFAFDYIYNKSVAEGHIRIWQGNQSVLLYNANDYSCSKYNHIDWFDNGDLSASGFGEVVFEYGNAGFFMESRQADEIPMIYCAEPYHYYTNKSGAYCKK